jgi:hypothetical protein
VQKSSECANTFKRLILRIVYSPLALSTNVIQTCRELAIIKVEFTHPRRKKAILAFICEDGYRQAGMVFP